MEQIEGAGIPVVIIDYNAQRLDRHLASTRAIGRVMGEVARAEELATLYEREYGDILARVARAKAAGAPTKTVYVELGRDGADTIGNTYNNTMWGGIVTALGATNLAAGKIPGPWGPLNAEAVIAGNPDLILFASSSWVGKTKAVRTGYDVTPAETRASLKPYTERPGWSGIKAVEAGEIIAIEHGIARTLQDFAAMQFIAKRLYPAAFADVDPVANFRAYHEKYLPIPFSGTWMLSIKP
jgi:iron complex transport system substrate-binding protein